MVLEHIFPEDWLERKGIYAFLLGIGYSIVGVLIASILFPGDPALVAVAFTSMLLLPELYKIFSIEERQESLEQRVSLRSLWRDDIEVVRIYVFLFLGIMLVYSVGTILLQNCRLTLFSENNWKSVLGKDLLAQRQQDRLPEKSFPAAYFTLY